MFYFLKTFYYFFCGVGVGGGDHTEGRQGGTTTIGLVMQEKTLPAQSPCQKGKNNNNNKPNPLGIMHRLHYVSQDPSSGQTRLVRLHIEPTSQKSLPKSLSFLLVGFKTTSVTNRRVFNTLNHDRLQGVSQFRYVLVYYYHIYIFILFFILFLLNC